MNDFKLTFTLKQHTPIIHFQHDQYGATLRASEVKPKLDKFLIEKLGLTKFETVEEKPNEKYKNWFINQGKQHLALDYKVQIISSNDIINERIEKNYPNYLGNMGNSIDEKGFVFSENIEISILAFNTELKNIIENQFSKFLSSTNFGNRSNKGFGCFSLKDIKQELFEKELVDNFKTVYKMQWKNGNIDMSDDHKFLFRKIQDEYKIIKAGDSRNKKESKLRQYFNALSTPIEWEKPYISNDVAQISKSNLKIDYKNNNFHYVRALLGLADHFEYIRQKVTVHFKPTDSGLERFSSPLLFKVFDNFLYLVPFHEKSLQLIKKNYEIKISYKRFGNPDHTLNDRKLFIPNIDFDIHDFLNFALKNTIWKKV